MVSTQAPLQSEYPVWQVQIPAVQTWEAPQAALQAPQWAGSLATSVHPAPQSTSPVGQPVACWLVLEAEQPKPKARTTAPVNEKRARCQTFGEP
jgi:hypothetical protein